MIGVRAWFGVLALCAVATAQRDDATFRLVPIEGADVEGRLLAISPSGGVSVQGLDTELGLSDLTELERVGEPANRATAPHAGAVWLRSGNTLGCGRPHGAPDRGLRFSPAPGHAPITVAAGALAAVRFAAADEADAGFEAALASPSATADLVFAWGRDGGDLKRYSLRVVGFDGADAQVETRGEVRPLPISRIYGIVFGTDNGAPPEPLPKPTVTVYGTFGAPLQGALREWDGVRCRIALAEGAPLSIACAQVARITVDTGRIAFLSQLEPAEVEQVAALDRPKPWLRDRTPIGNGLELGGRTWRRGLCLVPRTRLHYALAQGEWSVFEATVGIDDRSHHLAHATIRVLADDRVVFDSGALKRGDRPQSVSVDVSGVERLTLETDFGEHLDLGDHCVFAGARLRKDS